MYKRNSSLMERVREGEKEKRVKRLRGGEKKKVPWLQNGSIY